MEQRLFSTKEAAAYLGVSEQTIHKMRNSGELKSISFGASTRYDKADLDAVIEGKKNGSM
jgi:excisionase family DNA binding protein